MNNQTLFDPTGRLVDNELADADLQGCVNLAMRQQNVQVAMQLNILSCANSEVESLERIVQLSQLRFLNLANNRISNVTPLEALLQLGGLNLSNNRITDINPLLNIPTLASVSLLGNNDIPCRQLDILEDRLGNSLTRPERCRD